jgi:hypothetical protein
MAKTHALTDKIVIGKKVLNDIQAKTFEEKIGWFCSLIVRSVRQGVGWVSQRKLRAIIPPLL